MLPNIHLKMGTEGGVGWGWGWGEMAQKVPSIPGGMRKKIQEV